MIVFVLFVSSVASQAISVAKKALMTYFDVGWYLGSIERAQSLGLQHLFATHYAPLSEQAVPAFLGASQAFVGQVDELLAAILASAGRPCDMPTLIAELRSRLGIPEADYQYGLLLHAHLARLVHSGRGLLIRQSGWPGWVLAPG